MWIFRVVIMLVAGIPIFSFLGAVLLYTVRPVGALLFDWSAITFDHYLSVATDEYTLGLAVNTFLYVAASLTVGSILTVTFTWLVQRSDLPYRHLIPSIMIIPLAIPGAFIAFGWVLLASPRTGLLNLWLRGLLGMSGTGPLDIYTYWGMVLLTSLNLVPSMFFMLNSQLRNMDSALEEAGSVCGAPVHSVARYITLPMMTPALAASGIYFLIQLIETFEIPLVLGLNANFRVFSTHIFFLARPDLDEPQYGVAAVFATFLTIGGLGLTYFYMRLTRASYKYITIRGQRSAPHPVRLGRWKVAAVGFVCLYLAVKVVLPFIALLWMSLFEIWRPPSLEALGQVSLKNYAYVLQDPRWGRAFANTVILVVAASTGNVLLAGLIAWAAVRDPSARARWLLDWLAFLPRSLPNIVMALAVLVLLLRTPLYGTIWVIVIAHIFNYLAYTSRVFISSVIQIHPELEEAARLSGVRRAGVLRWIVLPLLRPAILNAWLWVAAHSIRDFTYPLMLGTMQNMVIANLLWQTWVIVQMERAAAITVMLMGMLFLFVIPHYYLTRRHRV